MRRSINGSFCRKTAKLFLVTLFAFVFGVTINIYADAASDSCLYWSSWSTKKPANGEYSTKTEYRYRSVEKTTVTNTDADYTVEGTEKLDSESVGWTAYTAWQNDYVAETAHRRVKTQTIPAVTKKVYVYYRYVSPDAQLSATNWRSGYTYEEIQLDYKLEYKGTTTNGQVARYGEYIYGKGGSYLRRCWYYKGEKTLTLSNAYTQYSYSDEIFEHSFAKYGAWSSWSTKKVSETPTRDVATRKLYRYQYVKHNYETKWTVDKKATCTANGSKSHHCTRCSAKKDVTEIKKKGHSYSSEWTVDKKATCTANGSKSHHCTRCSAKKDVTTIKKTGHNYKSTVTPATMTKNGKVVKICSVCKNKVTSTVYKIKTVKLSATRYAYNGKVKTPGVTVTDSNGNKLKKDRDYTVTYSKGRKAIGTYSVKITFKGKYSGSKTLKFNIVLGQVKGLKQDTSQKGIQFSWNKVAGADSYQVYQYNPDTKKYVHIATTSGTVIGNSKAKGTMKFKVRALRATDTKVIYGAFSEVKTFTAK